MKTNLLIPNFSKNDMTRISIALFAILLFSSIPLASAQFVISSNTSSGGLTSSNPPTINDDVIFSDGTTTTTIDIGDGTITHLVANVGDQITFTFSLSDDFGADSINTVDFYTDFGSKPSDINLYYANNFNESNQISQTLYSWSGVADNDSYNYSGDVIFTDAIVSTASNDFTISYTMTWNDVMSESEIMLLAADESTNYFRESLPITLEIVPVTESTSITTEEESIPAVEIQDEPIVDEPIVDELESIPSEVIPLDDVEQKVSYDIEGGIVQNIVPNPETNSLIISIDTTDDGSITLTLPRDIIDAKLSDGLDDSFFILVDGEEALFDEITNDSERIITIGFSAGVETIEIIGTFVIPEFGTIAMMILVISIISVIAISSKSRLMPRI